MKSLWNSAVARSRPMFNWTSINLARAARRALYDAGCRVVRVATQITGRTLEGVVITGIAPAVLVSTLIGLIVMYPTCAWLVEESKASICASGGSVARHVMPGQKPDKQLSIVARPYQPDADIRLVDLPIHDLVQSSTASSPMDDCQPVRQWVVSNAEDRVLLVIQAASVEAAGAVKLRIDLAIPNDDDDSYQRLCWWAGLSSGPEMLSLTRHSVVRGLCNVQFPTPGNCLSAYLQVGFAQQFRALAPKTYSKLGFTPEEFAAAVAMPMKNLLNSEVNGMIYNRGTLPLLVFSDTIQFVTTVMAIFALWFLSMRYVRAWNEQRLARVLARVHSGPGELARTASYQQLQYRWWFGCNSATLETSLEMARTPLSRDAAVARLQARAPQDWPMDKTQIGIVLSGFIGTLYFLSVSLFLASDLIAPNPAQVITALARLSQNMAGAFTTTLYAALLEFPLAFAFARLKKHEHVMMEQAIDLTGLVDGAE